MAKGKPQLCTSTTFGRGMGLGSHPTHPGELGTAAGGQGQASPAPCSPNLGTMGQPAAASSRSRAVSTWWLL